jgi:hypothetical protein
VLLHEQTCEEELGDDEGRVRMKGFMQGRQVEREREREEKEIGGLKGKVEREIVDYGEEMKEEERRKKEMKDAFVFAKERQRERALVVCFPFFFFIFSKQ